MKLKVDPEDEKYRINLSYHEVKWTRSPGLKNNNKVEVTGKENAVLKSIKTSGTGRGTLTVTAKIKYIDAASSQEKWENIKAEVYVTTFNPAAGAPFTVVMPNKGMSLRQRPEPGYSTSELKLNNGDTATVYGTFNNASTTTGATRWYYVQTKRSGFYKWMYIEQSAVRKETDIKGTLEEYIIKKAGLSALRGKKLEMTVIKNDVTIYTSFKYSGELCPLRISNNTPTYQDLFEQGIVTRWSGNLQSVFGYNITLKTVIDSNHKEISVKMENKLGISNMKDTPIDLNVLWTKSNPGKITMYHGDSRTGTVYSEQQFRCVAAHEFGHILGVEDYYKYDKRSDFDAAKNSIMNDPWNRTASSEDLQLVINAFLSDNWQRWLKGGSLI